MYGYVYLTTNKINGKMYIGMHKSSEFDKNYYGSGKILENALIKYGKENFKIDILEWCETPDILSETEVRIIKERNAASDPQYYNIIDTKTPILFGENNGFFGKKHTDETKKIISEKRIGSTVSDETKEKISKASLEMWTNPDLKIALLERLVGRNVSKETRDKISKIHKGKKLSEETKDKISKAKIGIKLGPFTQQHKDNISKALTGRKLSEEHINKINKNPEKIRKTAEKHRGMKRSDDARKNMSDTAKGKPSPHKGKKNYYNPTTLETEYCLEGLQTNGFILDDRPKCQHNKGKKYYHNPNTLHKIMCEEGKEPDGYIPGMGSKNARNY